MKVIGRTENDYILVADLWELRRLAGDPSLINIRIGSNIDTGSLSNTAGRMRRMQADNLKHAARLREMAGDLEALSFVIPPEESDG